MSSTLMLGFFVSLIAIQGKVAHPINPLEIQYLVNSLSRCLDSYSGCEVSILNGKLRVGAKVSEIQVTTLTERLEFNTDAIKGLVFYGPILVEYGNCSCNLMGKSLCLIQSGHSNPLDDDCNAMTDGLFVFLLTMTSIMVICSYLFFRYVKTRFYPHVNGHTLVCVERGIFSFAQKFRKQLYVRGKLTKSFNRIELNNLSERAEDGMLKPSTYVSRQYRLQTTLIALLFFIHPTASLNGSGILTYTHVMLDIGDTLHVDGFSIHVSDYGFHFPLDLMYYTAKWTAEMEYDWHCYDSSCNVHGKCVDHPRDGRFTTKGFYIPEGASNNSAELWWLRRYCQMGATGCFARLGCDKWVVKYKISRDDVRPVFGLGNPHSRVELLSNSSSGIQMVDYLLLDQFETLSVSILKMTESNFYLCPFTGNKNQPIAGVLGDLQKSDKMVEGA